MGSICSFFRELHPALFLWFFVSSVLITRSVQVKFPFLLLIPITLAIVFFRRRFMQALWRVRWVIFISGLVLPFTTPGSVIFSVTSVPFLPTKEGLLFYWRQVLYLITILSWWVIALSWMEPEDMLTGFLHLMSIFKFFGLEYQTFAVRLFLTFRYSQDFILGSACSLQSLKLRLEQFLSEASTVNSDATDSVIYQVPLLLLHEKISIAIWLIFCSTLWLVR